jgi:hypothetical protein
VAAVAARTAVDDSSSRMTPYPQSIHTKINDDVDEINPPTLLVVAYGLADNGVVAAAK